jgi:hypothetical protein
LLFSPHINVGFTTHTTDPLTETHAEYSRDVPLNTFLVYAGILFPLLLFLMFKWSVRIL